MRRSSWANAMSGDSLSPSCVTRCFPFFASVGDTFGMSSMVQARLVIDEPTVLAQIETLGK